MSSRTEILISGFGGQGVVRLGQILGQAAVHQGIYATMLISHGTETRGGYVRSQVVLSDAFIASPVVERPDYFCAFSQIAYAKYGELCGPESIILHDPGSVAPEAGAPARHLAVGAEALALESLGDAVYANVIFLGALSRNCTLLSPECIVSALKQRLPRHFEKNLQAFELGRSLTGLPSSV
jgi:2-oxoglutarate ferredoxin oxidoreductase subunit gamma